MNLRVVGKLAPLAVLIALIALPLGGGAAAGAAGPACDTAPASPGLELVYRAEAGTDPVSAATREQTAAVICARLRAIGVDGAGVELRGPRRIGVTLPRLRPASERSAIEVSGAGGRVHFYDWEPNLIGRERVIGGRPGFAPPRAVLRAAEREWRAAGRDPGKVANSQLIFAGAMPTARSAARLATRRAPSRIVHEHPSSVEGRVNRSAAPGWYALRDRPALSGADLVDVMATYGAFNAPSVSFKFTDRGRAAFERVTRRIAERGLAAAVGPVTGEQAAALSGHFAIVVDGEVMTRPIINFVENPRGIDGSTGAQISGGFGGFGEARALAAILGSGEIPLDLTLVSRLP